MTAQPKPRFTAVKLDKSQKPTHLYSYYASGKDEFPLDMLRYDHAWPASAEDAAIMADDDRSKVRSVRLHGHKEPTVERWSSFMWSVGLKKL